MPITQELLNAIGTNYTGKTITACFTNGTTAEYTASMLELLKTDSATEFITDTETGEILYMK